MLHIHSTYSLLSATSKIQDIIDKAVINKYNAIALTDINGMYGSIQFFKKAKEENIKPILGSMITEADDGKRYILLYAKNNQGYSDLCKIITLKKLTEEFQIKSLVEKDLSNLIIVTNDVEYLKAFNGCTEVFGEIILAKSFKKSNRNLLQFCRDNNIKFVVTNPVYFINKEDYLLYKVVNAIKQNTTIENLNKDELVDEEFYFKDAKVFKNAFVKLPEALQNQEYIINHCNVDLKLKEYKFPLYKLPEGENAFSLLWDLCQQGLEKRYKKITPKILERISYELSVINELNFSNYFLIVWDIVKEAQNRGMMLIGRGSAANSLVAYVLGLTQVDPIKHNLFFERFLNRGRSSPPDVDIDFSWKERDEIIRYIFQKYGYENCAMISTTITFRARSAFREVAKAFGLSNEEISKYSKFIPWTNAINLKNISEKFPESKSLNFNIEPFKSIVELASQLANFPRHLSIHPSGIIITPGPVTNFTALEYAKNKGLGLIITQPDMYSIEDLGLIKIDILSQRSLGVLRDTVEMIKHNKK